MQECIGFRSCFLLSSAIHLTNDAWSVIAMHASRYRGLLFARAQSKNCLAWSKSKDLEISEYAFSRWFSKILIASIYLTQIEATSNIPRYNRLPVYTPGSVNGKIPTSGHE